MIAVRGVLALLIIIAGVTIIVRMLPYGITSTFTGIILGLAMIALGGFRLRQIYRYGKQHR
jgi:hypothetical protein